MQKVTGRSMDVNYYEKEDEIWVAESHLSDDAHDITLTVEIDMAKMTVADAKIKFHRFPMETCPLIEKKAGELVGIKVNGEFTRNAMKVFMGPYGCPNILTLLNISIPGIIYYYCPHKIKTGKMTQEEWDGIVRGELKNACLAHTML
jgi:hypothetical protein